MASVKILLYKSKQNSKGQHPIALRITKDRIPKYKFLEYIKLKDWNEEKTEVRQSHHSYKRLNNLIDNEYVRAKNLILDFEAKDKKFTAGQLMTILKGNRDSMTFSKLAEEYLKEKELSNKRGYSSDVSRVEKFKNFLNGDDIHFENITESLLKRYEVYMKANGLKSKTSRANCLSVVRTIFNKAITEGIVDAEYYPFGKRKLKVKPGKTLKIGLDKEEIKKIEILELEEGSTTWHTRNVFLFSFYLAGIRISDTLHLKWNDIQSGRLYYQMGKNEKPDSLELPEKALHILSRYENDKMNHNDFVFPELKKANLKDPRDIERKINAAAGKFNVHLKKIAKQAEIDKKITNHISRHSFGNIAGSNIPVQMLQKLYRHSHLSTTIGYQSNFDHTKTDEALNNVLDF
ncbi:site-specific integrase [Aquimarina algiphila]|uniref:Tyrosine-type recombinase/integrase n=1 Tax=Aquimarina algiphila TaxID=2047982 RepID=A0A554VJA6_9FLAO|nr:site-specific integrase [Aquimarina algiphila]TSE07996.1 tyrosine-type recombinase/integrase [Aquimarina algiphila]